MNSKRWIQKWMLFPLFVCLFWLATASTSPASDSTDGKTVFVWSYYLHPPFIIEGKQGLTHDFLKLMNESAQGLFSFHLSIMPRKRIDQYLQANEPGIVLFVNPVWMKLPSDAAAYWSPPLFSDRNGIISNRSKQVEYTGPASVYGLTMGGVFGRKYKGLEEAIAQGKLYRQDASDEELNVLKISERRIDFMTAPESVLHYLVHHHGLEDKIYFSKNSLFEYERFILANNITQELQDFIFSFVSGLPSNPKWQVLMRKYELRNSAIQ